MNEKEGEGGWKDDDDDEFEPSHFKINFCLNNIRDIWIVVLAMLH